LILSRSRYQRAKRATVSDTIETRAFPQRIVGDNCDPPRPKFSASSVGDFLAAHSELSFATADGPISAAIRCRIHWVVARTPTSSPDKKNLALGDARSQIGKPAPIPICCRPASGFPVHPRSCSAPANAAIATCDSPLPYVRETAKPCLGASSRFRPLR